METPKANPPGTESGNSSQPPAGQTSGLASKVASQRGAIGPAAQSAKSPPKLAPTANKGGRKSAEQEVAEYLKARGLVAVPMQAGVSPGPDQTQPLYVVAPEFVGKVTKTVLEGVESWRVRNVALRVKALCNDMATAKDYAESSAAPPGIIDACRDSMIEVAKKYPAMLQWAPEVALCSALGTWFMKDQENMKRLDALEKRILEQMKQPPPVPATS